MNLHMHVHLTYILVAEFSHLQINQRKTFKNVVIEDEVDKIILFLCADSFLICRKGLAFP